MARPAPLPRADNSLVVPHAGNVCEYHLEGDIEQILRDLVFLVGVVHRVLHVVNRQHGVGIIRRRQPADCYVHLLRVPAVMLDGLVDPLGIDRVLVDVFAPRFSIHSRCT